MASFRYRWSCGGFRLYSCFHNKAQLNPTIQRHRFSIRSNKHLRCEPVSGSFLQTVKCMHSTNTPQSVFHSHDSSGVSEKTNKKLNVDGPSLDYFIANNHENRPKTQQDLLLESDEEIPYVAKSFSHGSKRKVYIETFGCQMNVNDTEIVWAILLNAGFLKTDEVKKADVVLIMTCSIREGAEQKIWKRLQFLKHINKKRKTTKENAPFRIGILGCMAERLKMSLLEKEKVVDLVCGPDAYRDLPRMLAITTSGQAAVNVMLSLDETYGDIIPVRINADAPSAFVSIMRGCDNMCTYCIVPFTRGRERSRPIISIEEEIRILSDQGVKEVTLLGQNVNSYRDLSEGGDPRATDIVPMSTGFSTVYRPRHGGRRFSDLLDKVSLINPEMRIRFTSPHPKDFPDEVLQLIRERPNICKHIHLPAQSGNNEVLAAMRRGYTCEAYLDLVQHIREVIPGIALSSDFIAGFCGETEAAHLETVSLMQTVKYNFAYTFPYSMRQKTRAYHRLTDDVPEAVKIRRNTELHQVFREEAKALNMAQMGETQLILIEGVSKRSSESLAGRNDSNTKVIVPRIAIPCDEGGEQKDMKMGDYVVVTVTSGTSQILHGLPMYHTSLQDFYNPSTVQEPPPKRASYTSSDCHVV